MSRTFHQLKTLGLGVSAIENAFTKLLDSIDPDDAIVYHRGSAGSCPKPTRKVAALMESRGLVTLSQRIEKGQDRSADDRKWQYLAIKRRPKS